jgi:hypothetical protein
MWKWAKGFFWRRQSIYGALLILLLLGIIMQLSLIPSQFAQVEVDYSSQVISYSMIGEDPLSLPHKLASYAVLKFSDSARAVRAVSIVVFGICSLALYRILKRWHSDKIALLATAMFATNATVLIVARLATPLVLIFSWSIVIAVLLWLQHGNSHRVAPFSLLVISAFLLYVPGAPYFFSLLVILFGHRLLKTAKKLKSSTIYVALISGILVITPLVLSFVNNINLLKQWLLLPEVIELSSVPYNLLRIPSAFIYKTPIDPLFNIDSLPILDVAAGGLFLIGLYAYYKNSKLERTKIMLITALFGIILGALGQTFIAIVLLLPYIYSVIAAGISYVLDEWYSVFPKNPFARSFGLILVTIVVLFSMYYQITRFLVVWPQTPETRAVYNQSGLLQ